MDRREFLRMTLTGTGLILAVGVGGIQAVAMAQSPVPGSVNPWIPNAWLQITPDNVVTLLSNKSEMGQGTWTGLAMVAADELEAEWANIRVHASPVADVYKDPGFGVQLTAGSTGIKHMYDIIRKAGASAREMLISAAAETWNVRPGDCSADKGRVIHAKSKKSLTYGELCVKAAAIPVPADPPLKRSDQFRFIGKAMPRLDIEPKVKGEGVFGIDVFVPGMLYSAVERPPVFGAKLVSFDKAAAEKVPGVHSVIPLSAGVAVTATSLEAAWKGKSALEAQWDNGSNPELNDESLGQILSDNMRKKGLIAKNLGNAGEALNKSSRRVEALYSVPYLAHAQIEPQNCTADVRKDACEIWCPTQYQTGVLQAAEKITGFPREKITIHTTQIGGGFGGKGELTVVEEALTISKAVDKPVKHIWSREEDFKNDFYRPGSLHSVQGCLDDQGHLNAWQHKVVVSPIFERFMPQMVKNGIDPTAVDALVDMQYAIPNVHAAYVRLVTPIPTGFWRSVGDGANVFVVESFIDEMAHAAKKDPLAFRLDMLKDDPRAAALLKKVAEAGGWGKPLPKGSGRGIAQRFCFGSYVAHLAEVSVDKETGVIKVNRMVAAVDCGQVVNPDSVIAQMEGAVVMGISAALKESVSFAKGGVATSNFSDYPLLPMSEVPEIQVILVTNGDKMGGIGEPGIPTVAPAIANAVFSATGVRLRSLPLSPDSVKKALQG
jgi:isoquinoline 1-oxidoreductase beta subunit